MYLNENTAPVRLNDRLSKLEVELDQLISAQERIREQSRASLTTQQPLHRRPPQCPCVNVTACSRTLISNRHAVTQCSVNGSAPLADITKFLQHINFNLSKGTQAISKMANTNLQKKTSDCENKNYHENCSTKKEEENSHDILTTNLCGKKVNEDALYKELREEKDKRMRAENQSRHLKDELKKTKCELQQRANQSLQQLQNKFKDALEKLEIAKSELEKRDQEFCRNEYLWPHKYEIICKQLQEEQVKTYEAERHVKELQEALQKMYLNTKEYSRLQETTSWLKEQNESLIYLSKRLQAEVEDQRAEIIKKSGIIDQNLFKIKQLSSLCEKLRDFLIALRQKYLATDERLRQNQTRSQKLTDKLLEAQSTSDKLKQLQLQNRFEQQRSSELFKSVNATNYALQARVEEMSEIMKQQNHLIAQQADTISNKEGELELAIEEYKLQSKKLEELQKSMSAVSDQKNKQFLESEIERLENQLQYQKENTSIKEKIVESNLETISHLKNTLARKEEDLNHKKRELAEREQKLLIEQTNNEQLQAKIKSLLNRKEELKTRVEELEEELENQVSSDQSKRLEQIEKQVKEKQLEWEEQKANLDQEKTNALQSMRQLEEQFAKNKNEYEEKLTVYQQEANELNSKLAKKEEQLKEAKEDVLKLKSELQDTVESAEKTKKSFEEKLRSACEAWQKTIQLLQN